MSKVRKSFRKPRKYLKGALISYVAPKSPSMDSRIGSTTVKNQSGQIVAYIMK